MSKGHSRQRYGQLFRSSDHVKHTKALARWEKISCLQKKRENCETRISKQLFLQSIIHCQLYSLFYLVEAKIIFLCTSRKSICRLDFSILQEHLHMQGDEWHKLTSTQKLTHSHPESRSGKTTKTLQHFITTNLIDVECEYTLICLIYLSRSGAS